MGDYGDQLVQQQFKPGDVVRVKSMYWKASIGGLWVIEKMLQKNWQCRRPDGYGPSKHKFLRAKPHQIEKVPDTAQLIPLAAQPIPSATKHLLNQPQVDNKKDIIVLRPGTVVLVKHDEFPGQFKGLYVVIENSHTGLTWVAVAPLFGGAAATIKTEYVTVIPQADLTIAYLPQ